MFTLELFLQGHLGRSQVNPPAARLRPPVTSGRADGEGVHLVHAVILGRGHLGPAGPGEAGPGPVCRVRVRGDGVAHPAGRRPARPVRAAHGALAAPGGGARPEAVRLGLLLCRRVEHFSLGEVNLLHNTTALISRRKLKRIKVLSEILKLLIDFSISDWIVTMYNVVP